MTQIGRNLPKPVVPAVHAQRKAVTFTAVAIAIVAGGTATAVAGGSDPSDMPGIYQTQPLQGSAEHNEIIPPPNQGPTPQPIQTPQPPIQFVPPVVTPPPSQTPGNGSGDTGGQPPTGSSGGGGYTFGNPGTGTYGGGQPPLTGHAGAGGGPLQGHASTPGQGRPPVQTYPPPRMLTPNDPRPSQPVRMLSAAAEVKVPNAKGGTNTISFSISKINLNENISMTLTTTDIKTGQTIQVVMGHAAGSSIVTIYGIYDQNNHPFYTIPFNIRATLQ